MSADAKIYCVIDGWQWHGQHDGEPMTSLCGDHAGVPLADCIAAVEKCLEQSLRWEFGGTTDTPILKGYRA